MLSGLVENTGSCLNIRPKRPVVDTEPGVASKPRGCDPWGPGWVGVVGAGCWAKTCGSAIGVLLSYLRPVENRLTPSQRWCHWSVTRHEVISRLDQKRLCHHAGLCRVEQPIGEESAS